MSASFREYEVSGDRRLEEGDDEEEGLVEEDEQIEEEQIEMEQSAPTLQKILRVESAAQRMDVFLMVRRKKLSIFTDATDNTSVLELKRIIEGILKVPPENQQLFNKDNQIMEDDKTLQDYGMVASVAKAQCPATVGLAIRMENGEFETLEIAALSSPPDLPYVMKTQETNGQEQSS